MTTTTSWSFLQKFTLRFICLYLLLYTFPFPLDYVPFIDNFTYETTEAAWDKIVPWFGEEVLNVGYEITTKPNGSGDTTWNYVQVLLMILLTLMGAIIWSVLSRQRLNYDKLYDWAIIFIRYYLAVVLMSYGFAKVFKSQFPTPSLMSLMQPLGDSSPMGLAWNFIGYSEGFNLFTGWGEAIGGFLLFFRRTKILGAFISIAVLSNIVAMNFCYDIPVKLYSLNLLLMTIFVLSPNFQSITNFLIWNKPTIPIQLAPSFNNKKWQKGLLVLKVAIIGWALYSQIEGYFGPQEWGDKAPKPPLYGIYEVEYFTINHDTLPPLTTDSIRWKNLIINWKDHARIQLMNDKKQHWSFTPDTLEKTIHIYAYRDSLNQNGQFIYAQPDESTLTLTGQLKGDSLEILFKKRDPKDFLLLKRGFNWINEYPFNR